MCQDYILFSYYLGKVSSLFRQGFATLRVHFFLLVKKMAASDESDVKLVILSVLVVYKEQCVRESVSKPSHIHSVTQQGPFLINTSFSSHFVSWIFSPLHHRLLHLKVCY